MTLNPLFQLDYFYLLNDLFFLAPALAGVGMLRRGRPIAAGALLGLSLGMKQQAILFLPLLAGVRPAPPRAPRPVFRLAAAGTLVLGVIVLPFLAWDPRAFLAGTAGFFYGSGVDSYPIRGIGLQGILLPAGVIGNRWDSFPSAQIQVPLLVIALVLALPGPAAELVLGPLLGLARPRGADRLRVRPGPLAQLPRPGGDLLPARARLSPGRRGASCAPSGET